MPLVLPKLRCFYTSEEVAKHNTADSLWVIMNRKVYDVTAFHKRHPGGPHVLLQMGGKDATEAAAAAHKNALPGNLMWEFCIGSIVRTKRRNSDAEEEEGAPPAAPVAKAAAKALTRRRSLVAKDDERAPTSSRHKHAAKGGSHLDPAHAAADSKYASVTSEGRDLDRHSSLKSERSSMKSGNSSNPQEEKPSPRKNAAPKAQAQAQATAATPVLNSGKSFGPTISVESACPSTLVDVEAVQGSRTGSKDTGLDDGLLTPKAESPKRVPSPAKPPSSATRDDDLGNMSVTSDEATFHGGAVQGSSVGSSRHEFFDSEVPGGAGRRASRNRASYSSIEVQAVGEQELPGKASKEAKAAQETVCGAWPLACRIFPMLQTPMAR